MWGVGLPRLPGALYCASLVEMVMREDSQERDPAALIRPKAAEVLCQPSFPVIGIGASAGGLGALKELLQAMPRDSGVALVIIQHLDPAHESQMASLLSRYTDAPVMEAREGLAPEPNSVYTIPPGQYLSLHEGLFHLEAPVKEHGLRMPIDFFFRSLAEARQEKAICVVLSGSGSDGTLGVRAIRGVGGLAVAQDPDTAEFDSMPRERDWDGAGRSRAPGRADTGDAPPLCRGLLLRECVAPELVEESTADGLDEILRLLLKAKTDFRGYKRNTLLRRVWRRMGVTQATTLDDYIHVLRSRPEEAVRLAKDVLIGVTSFFRDPEAYEELRRVAIAPVVQENEEGLPLRIWVAGCATGEEAYSLAMLVQEELEAAGKTSRCRCSPRTWIRRRWTWRAPGSTRRASPRTCRPHAWSASSPGRTTAMR